MIYLGRFCCICLTNGKSLEKLFKENKLSYYDKLSMMIPQVDVDGIKDFIYICDECKICTDNMYKFHNTCLNNNIKLRKYLSQLRLSENNKIIESVVLHKLEDKFTHKSEKHDLQIYKNITIKTEKSNINDCMQDDLSMDDYARNTYLDYIVKNNDIIPSIGNSTKQASEINVEKSSDDIYTQLRCTDIEIKNEDTENDYIVKKERTIDNYDTDYIVESTDPNEVNLTSEKTNISAEMGTSSEINLATQFNKNIDIKQEDISSLHTEIYINDCIKGEISNDDYNTQDITLLEHTIKNYSPNLNIQDRIDLIVEESQTTLNVTELLATAVNNLEVANNFPFEDNKEKDEISSKQLECKICMEKFSMRHHLKRHLLKHKYDKSTKSCANKKQYLIKKDNRKNKKSKQYSNKIKDPKSYKCKICNKLLHDAYSLKRHFIIHTGDTRFNCEICNKNFGEAYILKRHNRIHTSEELFKCETCNKSFTNAYSLNVHKRIHSGEKPHVCEICNKSYSYSYSLMVHKRTHTGEKPYKCETCKKSFFYHSSLKKHSCGDKGIYKCELCNKSFTLAIYLRKHTKNVHNET